jgi:tyrosine-protein phosphatase SIW14
MSDILLYDKYGKLVAAALAVQACTYVPVNHTSDPTANFVQVSEGLYRGARPDATGLQRLSQMGVRTILNLEDDMEAVADERKTTDALGMVQVSKPMNGLRTPDNDQMTETLGVLSDKANYPVFVHCAKGMDRTGVVIALHRVFNEGWRATDAEDEMMARGFNTMLDSLEGYFEQKAGL